MQETWVWSLSWEDPLEKGKATHSSILAWRISWTVKSLGSQRAGHNWATFAFTTWVRYCLMLLSLRTALWNGHPYYLHFTDEETEVFRCLDNFPLETVRVWLHTVYLQMGCYPSIVNGLCVWDWEWLVLSLQGKGDFLSSSLFAPLIFPFQSGHWALDLESGNVCSSPCSESSGHVIMDRSSCSLTSVSIVIKWGGQQR